MNQDQQLTATFLMVLILGAVIALLSVGAAYVGYQLASWLVS